MKPKSQKKSKGFTLNFKFDILTLDPHKQKNVTVRFFPVDMMTYGGIFEAIPDN